MKNLKDVFEGITSFLKFNGSIADVDIDKLDISIMDSNCHIYAIKSKKMLRIIACKKTPDALKSLGFEPDFETSNKLFFLKVGETTNNKVLGQITRIQ